MNLKTKIWVSFAAIMLVALILRLDPVLWQRDFWYDEAFTGILVKAPWDQMNQLIIDDVHPPLYYWLVKPFSAIFDYSPWGIRLFSLVVGMGLVASVFWIANKMFSLRGAVLASALTALSPFAIEYSQEGRMYTLFGLFFLWSVWFFYLALDKNKRKDWVWWGIFGGLSFYTHYLSLFFFVIFYVTFVVYQKVFNKKSLWPAMKGQGKNDFWLGTGIIFLFFLSWLTWFIPHMLKGNLGWIPRAQLSDLPTTLQIFFFGHPPGTRNMPWSNEFHYLFDGSSAGLLILILMIGTLVFAWLKNIKRKESLVLLTLSLGTLLFLILLSLVNLKLYVARYFISAAVLIYIWVGGMAAILLRGKRKYWAAGGLVVYFLLLLFVLKPINYTTGWNQLHRYDQLELTKPNGKKPIFVAENPFDYAVARYYFGLDRVLYYNKENPTEDFTIWVVVGNKNRIIDLKELTASKDYHLLIASTCDWPKEEVGVELTEVDRFDNVSVCEIR